MFNIVFIGFGIRSEALWKHAFSPTGECKITAIVGNPGRKTRGRAPVLRYLTNKCEGKERSDRSHECNLKL